MLSNKEVSELRLIAEELTTYITFLANKRVSISGQEALVNCFKSVKKLDKILKEKEE